MVDEPITQRQYTDTDEAVEKSAPLDAARLSRELCPISRAICMLEKKWTIHILYELSSGKRRFCHLQDAIGNANSRTLSERLKELELQGLIRRDVIQSIPPWVEYSLTDKGTDLCRLIEGVADWARKWSMFGDDCWVDAGPSSNGVDDGADSCSTCDSQGDLDAIRD